MIACRHLLAGLSGILNRGACLYVRLLGSIIPQVWSQQRDPSPNWSVRSQTIQQSVLSTNSLDNEDPSPS